MGKHDKKDGRLSEDRHRRDKHSKKEKTKKRDSSVSSDSNSFDRRLECFRTEIKTERKKERERVKDHETLEQKRERRLAKKLLKEERKNNVIKGVLPESIPYTDTNNPFNDNNLTDVFVWNKKLEAEGKSNLSKKQIEKLNRERIFRNVAEMEELKKNRDARQAAKEDIENISREQERSQYSDWRRTEDTFHLNQAKLRSQIRLHEGRAKPIDLLSRYISYGNNASEEINEEEFELKEPMIYLKGLILEDYEDLLMDIKVCRVLNGKRNDNFWDDITTITNSEIKKAINQKQKEETGDVHIAVVDDMINVFKNKTYDELDKLSAQIQSKIKNASRGTDVGYWETTLQTLGPFMAKQRLKELHSKKLALKLKHIREEQSREMAKHEQDSGFRPPDMPSVSELEDAKYVNHEKLDQKEKKLKGSISSIFLPFTISELDQCDDEMREQKWNLLNPQQLDKFTVQLFAQGGYSPKYGNESQAMPGIEILSEKEDRSALDKLRHQQRQGGFDQSISEEHAKMLAIAQQGMGQDETVFSDESAIEQQSFLWSDKYRPRKPRYFNRVHTGFDWNKYNQTHYDIDNPPPKIVQGYRFNIFYPDMLDVTETPSFQLTECDDHDFAILRFKCGPPYEDIAFKIVNREWEINHKHGYKCQLQNGVFQLWFFFKRYRYRR